MSDGSSVVVTSEVVLNEYAELALDVAAGASTLSVTDIGDLDERTSGTFAQNSIDQGTLLLVIQMQGADFTTTNAASFGTLSATNGAGQYELVRVASVSGDTITLETDSSFTGLANSYSTAGHTQVVRVPQYEGLIVRNAGTVTADAWDGSTGGIVALSVLGDLKVNGAVDVSGLGFRGGEVDNDSGDSSTNWTDYLSSDQADGGMKGEGIGGWQSEYSTLSALYGRGAAVNGGGGGNAHNGGGGGGANGDNGNTWTGQGVMDSHAAWSLDPTSTAANSSGGGRGGYSFSYADEDATSVAPGDSDWNGNRRSEVGGLGGRPLTQSSSTAYLGGGGGAGDGNNDEGGSGGAGGGLVMALVSGKIKGNGDMNADGAAGGDASTSSARVGRDGPGGGGAGGTLFLVADDVSNVSLSAAGGSGGLQWNLQH